MRLACKVVGTFGRNTSGFFLATECAAHALSWLMKDVLMFETLTNILKEAKEILLFIRSPKVTDSRFESIQESARDDCQRGLKLPVATRWYSAYDCIKLVKENEKIIRELFDDQELLKKIGAINEIIKLAALVGYNEEKRKNLQTKLTASLRKKLTWSDENRTIYYSSPPSEWWTWDGRDKYPLLAPIAQRVFAIPTSSEASERSWSIFKFIHSARRNRLGNDTVIKLAFIYSNHGPKEATTLIGFDPVVDLVRAPGKSCSTSGNTDCSVSTEMLDSIREMEQFMGGTDDSALPDDTPLNDSNCLNDENVFDGAHWGDENHFPNQLAEEYTF